MRKRRSRESLQILGKRLGEPESKRLEKWKALARQSDKSCADLPPKRACALRKRFSIGKYDPRMMCELLRSMSRNLGGRGLEFTDCSEALCVGPGGRNY